jgi:antitoxin VapB
MNTALLMLASAVFMDAGPVAPQRLAMTIPAVQPCAFFLLSPFFLLRPRKKAMALNIKSAETERLAREVAALTGDTITEAVRKALALRLEQARAEREAEIERKRAKLKEIQERVRKKLGGRKLVITKRNFDELWGELDEDQ